MSVAIRPGAMQLSDWHAVHAGAAATLDPFAWRSIDASAAAVQALLEKEATARLFDPEAVAIMERRLQALNPSDRARDGTELVELLRRIGDLTEDELGERAEQKPSKSFPNFLPTGGLLGWSFPIQKFPYDLSRERIYRATPSSTKKTCTS